MSKLACVFLCIVGAAAGSECEDAKSGSNCYENIQWARETGLAQHPAWYEKYPISGEAPDNEWQCVLYTIETKQETPTEEEDPYPAPRLGCSYPCTYSQLCPEWDDGAKRSALRQQQEEALAVQKVNTVAGVIGFVSLIVCLVGVGHTFYFHYISPKKKTGARQPIYSAE